MSLSIDEPVCHRSAIKCSFVRSLTFGLLALAAMLLVYFLPVVIPPLQWLNVGAVTDFSVLLGQWPTALGPAQMAFAAGMLGLFAATLHPLRKIPAHEYIQLLRAPAWLVTVIGALLSEKADRAGRSGSGVSRKYHR